MGGTSKEGLKRLRLTGLWGHADFVRLWTGQTISLVGSQVTFLALPLTAALTLRATPAQMGLLTAIGSLPSLVLGLPAGAWVDRHRRRPLLIAADLGRGLLLMAIPIAALLHALRIEHLYVIELLMGVLNLLFGVACCSFLPTLVGREQLVEGNSKLEVSRSVAEIAGPGLAGGLVQWVTAPIAVDALSFLVSALFLGLIRAPEPEPAPAGERPRFLAEIGEGLGLVWGDRVLRAIAGCAGMVSLFNGALEAIYILYLTRELGMGAAMLGLSFAFGSVGFLAGALILGRVSHHFGLGPGIVGGLLLAGASDLLVPLLGRSVPLGVLFGLRVVAQFLFGLGLVIFNTGQVSLRQGVTPDRLQGRMNATLGFIGGAVVPLGGFLGGVLGGVLGLRATLVLAALGEMLSISWLLLSPIRTMRALPVLAE